MTNPIFSLWLGGEPLVLASGSATRRQLLEAAGIPIAVVRPDVDERALEDPMRRAGAGAADRARLLARAKAVAGCALAPGRLVLGADQTLEGGGHPGVKAADRMEAAAFLRLLSGRAHALHAGACLAIDGRVVWEGLDTATLHLRRYDDPFIERYLDAVGPLATSSVGGYQIEGLGTHLIDRVEGEHAVVLGMPLGRLLGQLRRLGLLAA